MTKTALFPDGSTKQAEALKVSPGILSHGHVFVTGVTGSGPDGAMPRDPETQFRQAFHKIGAVLHEAGLTHRDIVEMTSYHLDIATHFDLFSSIRKEFVVAPYPAWTAVEVSGLRRAGALVEIRVVAACCNTP